MLSFFKKKQFNNREINTINDAENRLLNLIENIKVDDSYISNIKKALEQNGFTNIQVCVGEKINSKHNKCDVLCVDMWIYKGKQMYMLTVYCDGVVLLREVIDEDTTQEELDEENYNYSLDDVFRLYFSQELTKINIEKRA